MKTNNNLVVVLVGMCLPNEEMLRTNKNFTARQMLELGFIEKSDPIKYPYKTKGKVNLYTYRDFLSVNPDIYPIDFFNELYNRMYKMLRRSHKGQKNIGGKINIAVENYMILEGILTWKPTRHFLFSNLGFTETIDLMISNSAIPKEDLIKQYTDVIHQTALGIGCNEFVEQVEKENDRINKLNERRKEFYSDIKKEIPELELDINKYLIPNI
jgi:hypothetical protein